jgi:hypothetical protein
MANQVEWIPLNATSQIIEVMALNGSHKGVTGIAFGDVNISVFERGKSGAAALETLVAGTLDTFVSNGWKEVDATNQPGLYQYCIPNAKLQTTSSKLHVYIWFDSGTTQDVIYEINIQKVSSYLGVKLSTDGVDAIAIEAKNLREAITYMAAVLCGETTGAETAQTIFKALDNNAVSRLTSQSSDTKNRTAVTLIP